MISVFGANGFIGSKFCEKISCHKMGRNDIHPPDETKTILYLISTVDNFNVLVNPYIDIETNLIHLIRVLESCKGKEIEFVFISSWFVYGEVELPAKEEFNCNPKGFYSITKLTAEKLLQTYCETFEIKYKIIRLGNVIGPTDNKISIKKNILQYLINEMQNNRDISLHYGGDFYRDFIHVDDVVNGINLIINKGKFSEIYNLSSGYKPTKFYEIINYIHKKINSQSNINTIEPSNSYKNIQVKSMILDNSKIKALGLKPKYELFDAIDNILK